MAIRSKEYEDNLRIIIKTFQGRLFVDIRYWYIAPNGEIKPGPCGIMLNVQQISILRAQLAEIFNNLSSLPQPTIEIEH